MSTPSHSNHKIDWIANKDYKSRGRIKFKPLKHRPRARTGFRLNKSKAKKQFYDKKIGGNFAM